MGKKVSLLPALVLILLTPHNDQAQWGETVVSPEVHPNRTVTFRLPAPTADSVSIWVEFLDAVVKQLDQLRHRNFLGPDRFP